MTTPAKMRQDRREKIEARQESMANPVKIKPVVRYVIITARGEAFVVNAKSKSEAQTYFHLKMAGAVISDIFQATEL